MKHLAVIALDFESLNVEGNKTKLRLDDFLLFTWMKSPEFTEKKNVSEFCWEMAEIAAVT